MAELQLGNIKPAGADNVVVDSKYVKGGYTTVSTITDRNALSASGQTIINGSLCYVTTGSDAGFYQYTGSNWAPAKFGDTYSLVVPETAGDGDVELQLQNSAGDAVSAITIMGNMDGSASVSTEGGVIYVTANIPDYTDNDYNVTSEAKTTCTYYLTGSESSTIVTGPLVKRSDVYVNSSGQLSAKSFIATSDTRLKENFVEYKSDKSILDLPIYTYDFIDGAKNQLGCKAQDLQEICPDIVVENENGYLSIQESKIVYLLLEEVKQLKKQVAELEEAYGIK